MSVLKLKVGDNIQLSHAEFVRLADAFFEEIEKKYLSTVAEISRWPMAHWKRGDRRRSPGRRAQGAALA